MVSETARHQEAPFSCRMHAQHRPTNFNDSQLSVGRSTRHGCNMMPPGTSASPPRRLLATAHVPRRTPVIRVGPDYRRSPPDLVAAALGPTAEAAEIVAKRGVKAARVRAILAEIARRFGDPTFDLDSGAGTLGLSRRYVQQLLEETGKSVTEHLVERRLERPV